MTITGGSGLPKGDIDSMIRDAEQYAEEDRTRRESAEARNSAEGLVYSTEKFIADNDDKLPEDAKSSTRDAIASVRTALGGEDVEAIKEATDNLSRTSQQMGAALYANAQSAAGSDGEDAGSTDGTGESSADGTGQDDVVDAEIVDEDAESRS